MHRWILRSVPVLAICAMGSLSTSFNGQAMAEEAAPPAKTEASTPQNLTAAPAAKGTEAAPAVIKKDLSSPKSAIKTFVQALANGDVEMAKAAAISNDSQGQMIELMAKMTGGMKKLTDAATAKFGEAGEEITGQKMKMEDNLKQIDDAKIEVKGDEATIISQDQKSPVTLKKVNGEWKVDIASMPNVDRIAEAAPMINAMANAASATTADINADKYKTVDEAKAAFRSKMMAAMMASMPQHPSTQPGTTAPDQNEGNGQMGGQDK